MKSQHSLILWMQIGLALGLVLLVGLGAARTVQAVEFDDDGIIPADVVVDDDVFISHDTILVDGAVNGDLFLNGGQVTVNGPVGGNLVVNASTAVIKGPIGGSLVFAGRTLKLDAPVAGSIYGAGAELIMGEHSQAGHNVYFTGFGLRISEGAQVGRDVLSTSYQAILNGSVGRHVNANVEALEIGGQVGGNVTAVVGKPDAQGFYWFPDMPEGVPAGLRVLDSARIQGQLTYTSPVEQAEAIRSQPGGGVVYRLPEKKAARSQLSFSARLADWAAGRVRWLVTLSALGALAAWLLPQPLQWTADKMRRKPLPALGLGLLGIPLAILLALSMLVVLFLVWILLSVVTLEGLAQAFAGLGFGGWGLVVTALWVLVAFGSKLAVAYLAGDWLFRRFSAGYSGLKYWPLLSGVVFYVVLQGIPCLGIVLDVICTLVGFGAILMVGYHWRALQAALPAPQAVPPAVETPSGG